MSEARDALIQRYQGVFKTNATKVVDESISEAFFHATADLGLWNRNHPDEPIRKSDTWLDEAMKVE